MQKIRRLKYLDLQLVPVTDGGLAELGKLTGLVQLYINSDKITDAGLRQLKPLTKLRLLHLGQSSVTDKGIAVLKAALPSGVIVIHDG